MKRIFVLEDDKGWEAYYRRALKKYDLAFFNNGIEAIAAMDDERPDLVILDVLLAGPTGFALGPWVAAIIVILVILLPPLLLRALPRAFLHLGGP